MRKSTKNKLTKAFHGVLIIFTVISALIASLYAALRDVSVQSIIARSAADFVSKSLKTDVKINTFYITPDLELHLNGLQINDLEQYPMLKIDEFKTSLAMKFPFDQIRFEEVYLKNALCKIVTYEGNEMSNLAEMLSQVPENQKGNDTGLSNDLNLIIKKISIENAHFILWNQNRDQPERKSMDYRHLDFDSINLDLHNFEYRSDTITGFIKDLNGKERCGADLKSFTASVLFCPTDINIGNMRSNLNNSYLDMNLEFKVNDLADFDTFEDSVVIVSNIRNTRLRLDDIKYWAYVMRKMPNDVVLNTDFYGPVNDFKLNNLDISFGECSNIRGFMSMRGICYDTGDSYWVMDFPTVKTSYNDLIDFYIPSSSITIPLPEMLEPMGNVTLSVDYRGTPKNFNFKTNVNTEIGNVKADLLMRAYNYESPQYAAAVVADNVDIARLLASSTPFEVTMSADINGEGFDEKTADFMSKLRFKSLKYNENEFDDFIVDVSMKNEILKLKTDIANDDVNLKLSASSNFKYSRPLISAVANISEANLNSLHLIDNDSIVIVSTDLNGSFSGFNIDDLTANLKLDSTTVRKGTDDYYMDYFVASLSENQGVKSASVSCDFFDFQADGIVNHRSFVNAMKNTLLKYVHIPEIKKSRDLYNVDKQEFAIKIDLKNTDMLTRFFMPQLHVASGSSFAATYTTGDSNHGQTLECPEIKYNNFIFRDIEVRNTIDQSGILCNVSVGDVILKDSSATKPHVTGVENFVLTANASNDTVDFNLKWNDEGPVNHNKADVKSRYVPNEKSGGLFTIDADTIIMRDTLLELNGNTYVIFKGDETLVHNLGFHTKSQALTINGLYPKHNDDTLSVSFVNLDMSDINFLLIDNDLSFAGDIDGDLRICGLSGQPMFDSDLKITDLSINNNDVGDVVIDADWLDSDKSINIESAIYSNIVGNNDNKTFDLNGKYYPDFEDGNLDFKLAVDGFKLNSVTPFVSSVISRLDGEIFGNINVVGSLKKPVLEGDVTFKDAGCKIDFLNTYYKINNTVAFSENRINVDNLQLTDTIGSIAYANGVISHNYLRDFDFDIKLRCNDFAALNIPAEKEIGFYGSAVANGDVVIKGPINDILLDIDVRTRKGTEINIPLSSTSTVDDNFIVFVQKSTDIDTIGDFVPPVKETSNLTLDLNAEVNPDATLQIFLPSNMGMIQATGTGNVNLGMKSGDFTLNGNYVINSGLFAFRLQVVSRNFNIRNGGTIHFNGDPTDADIDIVSTYRTKVSLKSLGSSIAVDTTINNTINVDCILHLRDKLMNPTITFGLELPNAKDDIKSAVFSVIDTTNQAVMAQQVLSLMVIGMFANTGNTDIAEIGSTAYYGVITSQLNNWLSSLSKDFDIGVNYKPNSKMTNEEIEVAMSTQLFDDRLTIEGDFGVVRGNNGVTNKANNIVGDVDVSFKLTNRLSVKAYNHTNVNNNYATYNLFESMSDYTQGLGISLSQSFDKFREIFSRHNKDKHKDKTKDRKDKKQRKTEENDPNERQTF